MRSISSLDGPLKASRPLSRLCAGRQGVARRACEGLNPHRPSRTPPRLRSTCVYLKSSRDRVRTWGRLRGEDFR
jgi:hypothetical protein